MELTQIHSIQEVSVQYTTGDLPVLVLCSDAQRRIIETNARRMGCADR